MQFGSMLMFTILIESIECRLRQYSQCLAEATDATESTAEATEAAAEAKSTAMKSSA